MPKVSVILSSYNHAPYVAEAIESVLNQTFRDFELLIYDDGSTDGSADIIRSFRDERIKTFLYEKNRGPLDASKEAYYAAQGEYIAVHHSDDVWEQEKLEYQVDFLDHHQEYAACFSRASFIDENGKIYELEDGSYYKNVFAKDNRSRIDWLRYFFNHPNCFCHPSLLIRREMYEKHLLVPPKGLRQFPDFYMWLKLLAGGEEIYVSDKSLVRFRLRTGFSRDNVSTENYDNILRCTYEYTHLASIYRGMKLEDFCKVFPDYLRYVLGDDIRLALGKACLASDYPAYRLYGLKLLDEILNDSQMQYKLEGLYDFKDFWNDTGHTDCFGVGRDLHIAKMTLFYDCGNGFWGQEGIKTECYIPSNGYFQVSLSLKVPEGTRALRFDPDEGEITKIQLYEFQVNGTEVGYACNGVREQDGYDAFYHGDPCYASAGTFSGMLEVKISGRIIYPELVEAVASNFHNKQLLQIELENCKEQLQIELENCKEQLLNAKNELELMRNSMSWRCTRPMRTLGGLARKIKS